MKANNLNVPQLKLIHCLPIILSNKGLHGDPVQKIHIGTLECLLGLGAHAIQPEILAKDKFEKWDHRDHAAVKELRIKAIFTCVSCRDFFL